MNLLSREEELKLFRKICSQKKIVDNKRINRLEGNSIRAGYYNQGIAKAKLKEYIASNNLDFSSFTKED